MTASGGGAAAAKSDRHAQRRSRLPAPTAARLSLRDVLFGDVFLCGGQSNMQYTPRSMDGMNNMSAEIAAADNYAEHSLLHRRDADQVRRLGRR